MSRKLPTVHGDGRLQRYHKPAGRGMKFRTSFRSKLLLLTLLPLAIAQIVTLLAVMRTVEQDVDKRARTSLAIGGNVVSEYMSARSEQLRTSVNVLTADFGLKQAAATLDADTIRSVLENHSQRVGANLAIYLDLDGDIIAGARDSSTVSWQAINDAVDDSFVGGSAESTLTVDETIYHTFTVPLMAPIQIGWVVFGFQVDQAMLERLRDLTGLDVELDLDSDMTANTVYELQGQDGDWLALHVPFVHRSGNVDIVLMRSVQEAMLPYIEARRGLVAFGLLLLTSVALAAAWLSGGIARPLRDLTDAAKRMITGRYDEDVPIGSDDEFGELATSFNAMRTAIAEREDRISHQAMHDAVTGLPNRIRITQQLEELIEDDRNDRGLCVLSIRLLRLNAISSTLGHSARDEVVTLAAKHLKVNLDDDEILGHVGTNEFVLVIPDGGIANAMARADKMEGILATGVTLGRVNIGLQTEVGIASFPEHGEDAANLLRNASIARSEAEIRRERVMVYEPGREDYFVQQLRMVNDLRSALQRGQVFLNFQPKVSLPDGKFCGAEALVRWNHPELGLLMPDSFVPAAEQAGTIVHLTRHVISEALRHCREWRDHGIDAGVAVNLSVRDLQDEYLPYFVLQELKDKRVGAKSLTLEITENSVMQDVNHAITVLECLRDIGVRISIDDFGTGHSSLAQLRNIPLHELKIDKSFVMNLCDDEKNEAIVRTTIELAHNMNLEVVAEGVENEETLRRLSRAGCERAQGYFLAKPLSSADLLDWHRGYEPVSYEERRKESRPFADSA
jgi:diguanylate cyclase (GGDEF)-like protein